MSGYGGLPGVGMVRVSKEDGEYNEEWPVLSFKEAKLELISEFMDRWGEPEPLPVYMTVSYIDSSSIEPQTISVEVGDRNFIQIEETLTRAKDPLDLSAAPSYDVEIIGDILL